MATIANRLSQDRVAASTTIQYNLINKEFVERSTDIKAEMNQISELYQIYKLGADFETEGSLGDYSPSKVLYKNLSSLIRKEARFLFAETPDFTLSAVNSDLSEDEVIQLSDKQELLDKVLTKNNISKLLVQAAKDAFIGKRIAICVDVNEKGIKLTFYNSMEFVFETEVDDTEQLTKFVSFKIVEKSSSANLKRVLMRRLELQQIGTEQVCVVSEYLYDGLGNLKETILDNVQTRFNYIPVAIVINDGLIGDMEGESEVQQLMNLDSSFSRIANADIDAERKSMNPIRYTVGMSPESTENLSSSAGSYWELIPDQTLNENSPQVGTLAPSMGHTDSINSTLSRIKSQMHEFLDVPDINLDTIRGQASSGKALKAIYWPLIVRCKEKMKVWAPALEKVTNAILDSAELYPELIKGLYIEDGSDISNIDTTITIESNYPLLEDEAEEKGVAILEVDSKVMSRKAYMKKFYLLTDEEVDKELLQIAKERELIEDSYSGKSDSVNEEPDVVSEGNDNVVEEDVITI